MFDGFYIIELAWGRFFDCIEQACGCFGCGGGFSCGGCFIAEFGQQFVKAQFCIKFGELVFVGTFQFEFFVIDVDWHIGFDNHQLFAHIRIVFVFAKLFASFAFDGLGICEKVVHRAELLYPLQGGLWADIGYAGDVVGFVALKSQHIEKILGRHLEFVFHIFEAERFSGFYVESVYVFIEQLEHILVF